MYDDEGLDCGDWSKGIRNPKPITDKPNYKSNINTTYSIYTHTHAYKYVL